MVRSVDVTGPDDDAAVTIGVDLTIAGCPLVARIRDDVTAAVSAVDGVTSVAVEMGVMDEEKRQALVRTIRGGAGGAGGAGAGGAGGGVVIPFAAEDSPTRVIAVASGKGGVGKSSITANLAVALADSGLRVGVVDADIYGFSIPRMLGVSGQPTKVDTMLIPPVAHGVKVMSIGMFVPQGTVVAWRGPKLHRALEQFLADVLWGELDVLLLDLPPGTGDVALSVASLLPGCDLVIVTTPQDAAAEVAERAGALAKNTVQNVLGVIENMSGLTLPDGTRLDVFGTGGGERVAQTLSAQLGVDVPLLGQIPLDPAVREGGDQGEPVVLSAPESEAAQVLRDVAQRLVS